ncbi:MAG: hypothetical protein KatS3mg098_473 [Candidatus Parcubacteria bacterium]|nr:MAG: hypothetical protein KatS3mg098_473 [Candidatus Parcubacteria bacterium]
MENLMNNNQSNQEERKITAEQEVTAQREILKVREGIAELSELTDEELKEELKKVAEELFKRGKISKEDLDQWQASLENKN